MVTTSGVAAAGISRPYWLPAGLLLVLFAACVADRETTLSRSARGREVGAAQAERQQQQRQLVVVRQESAATAAAIETAKADSVRRSAELRAVLAELHYQVSVQQTAEQDLAAAKARAVVIEQELQPLRALEATLQGQERLKLELQQRVVGLQAEVDAVQLAVAQTDAELQPRLLALQQRLEAAKQLEQAVGGVDARVSEALRLLVPPAPPVGKPPEAKKP